MKSLSDNYASSHAGTHETFADLVFCALVVLVLFVFTLAVEVSQRVRANIVSQEVVPNVDPVESIETLTPAEVKELSEKLQKQQRELESQRQRMLAQEQQLQEYRNQVAGQEATVANRMAALNGEQRFTGATEPAVVQLAYEYKKDRFVFIRRKEFEHAVTRKSGESDLAFAVRSSRELVALALESRKQRYYTDSEANRIYAAFTTYQQINPTADGFSLSNERIVVMYALGLSGYITGDENLPAYGRREIEEAIDTNFSDVGEKSEAMYPSAVINVLENRRRVVINGVTLTAKDFKDILLSIGGRGVMLDFTGYDGPAPDWLVEEVLTPTGYIGKTPKLPE